MEDGCGEQPEGSNLRTVEEGIIGAGFDALGFFNLSSNKLLQLRVPTDYPCQIVA